MIIFISSYLVNVTLIGLAREILLGSACYTVQEGRNTRFSPVVDLSSTSLLQSSES